MGLTAGQASATGTTPVRLTTVPPGPGQVLVVPVGGSTSALVGLGTVLTATSGVPVPAGGLTWPLFQGGGAGTLYGITTAGTVGLGWIVSYASGLGQPGQQ